MASIDKAAIAFSIAIVVVGVGFAFYMDGVQSAGPVVSAPVVSKTVEPKTQTDPFAGIADKVKSETATAEKTMELKEKVTMEEKKDTMEEKKDTMAKPTGPTTHTVDIPKGTSVPGCEESNACYLPADITINAGDTVEWINVDTAAHTVTGGSPADGPSGVFDSSLVMANAVYAFTFNDSGSYDYFCMVHPWMVGTVTVN
ncbi:MAG: hypothetical protein K5777_06570 [Nitrosopumilus sp.]|nr:hypothetical protein [Nitrosopumilus sp.]